MIIIASRLFDATYSPIVLHEDPGASNINTTSRRLNRTATLDGGVIIDDAGYSDGDRTMTIIVQAPSAAQRSALQALMEADGIQRIATTGGVFEGGIERLSDNSGGRISITFMVRSKRSG